MPNSYAYYYNRNVIYFLLVLFICLFIFHKLPFLNTALFWDEAGVYGRGILKMLDGGNISLHPSVIDSRVSRGHPLLFTVIYATILKTFDGSILNARIITLIFSLAFLITIFFSVRKIFDKKVAFTSVFLLGIQPIYSAHSILILPELVLGFFIFLTVISFWYNKFFFYLIFCVTAIFIKETAVILPLGFVIFACFNKHNWGFRFSIKNLKWLLPIIPYIIFLAIQKKTFGWYLFPHHRSGFSLILADIFQKLSDYTLFIFWEQGRFYWPFVILWFSKKTQFKKIKYNPQIAFLFLLSTISFGYILFSSTNYYMNRYILPIIPFLVIILSYLINKIFKNHKYILAIVLLGIFINHSQYQNSNKFNYDEDLSFVDITEAHKQLIGTAMQKGYFNRKYHTTFPINYLLTDYRYGYLTSDFDGDKFAALNDSTEYIITSKPGGRIKNVKKLPLKLELEKKYKFIKYQIHRIE